MVCRGANTTVNDAAEDEDSHDFCAPTFQHFCGSLSLLRMLCGSDVPEHTTLATAVAPCTSICLSAAADSGSTSLLSCAACFRVLALRRGATLVTAATLRLFGANFAELPFVATKEGEVLLAGSRICQPGVSCRLTGWPCARPMQPNLRTTDYNYDCLGCAGYRREGHLRRLMQVRVH